MGEPVCADASAMACSTIWLISDAQYDRHMGVQELRDSFKFSCFLVVSRVYEDNEVTAGGSSRSSGERHKQSSHVKKVCSMPCSCHQPESYYLPSHQASPAHGGNGMVPTKLGRHSALTRAGFVLKSLPGSRLITNPSRAGDSDMKAMIADICPLNHACILRLFIRLPLGPVDGTDAASLNKAPIPYPPPCLILTWRFACTETTLLMGRGYSIVLLHVLR